MSVIEEFKKAIAATDVVGHAIKNLTEEPAWLLREVCTQFERTSQPVSDFNLQVTGYIGETSLKALIQAGFVERSHGGHISLYAYQPTESGLKTVKKLIENGFFNPAKLG